MFASRIGNVARNPEWPVLPPPAVPVSKQLLIGIPPLHIRFGIVLLIGYTPGHTAGSFVFEQLADHAVGQISILRNDSLTS